MKIIFTAIVSILLLIGCSGDYDRGYENGFKDGHAKGFSKGSNAGYEKGVSDGQAKGFDKGYSKAMKEKGINSNVTLQTIDSILFSSKGSMAMFWVFSILNIIAFCGAGYYLISKDGKWTVITAKVLVFILASYFWFRVLESQIFSQWIPGSGLGETAQLIVEIGAFIFSIIICSLYDHLFIKEKADYVWVDALGIAFITLALLQLIHYLLNFKTLFSVGGPTFILHSIEALSMGGISYVIYSLLSNYTKSKKV